MEHAGDDWQDLLVSLIKRYRPERPPDLSGAELLRREVNRSCGDSVAVYRRGEETLLHAQGCAVARASSAIAGKMIPCLSEEETRELCGQILRYICGNDAGEEERDELHVPPAVPDGLSRDLRLLSMVRRVPGRHRCATLPWEALLAALKR